MEKQDILKVVRANEGTVLSFPDRGPWGNNRYRGNCSGYIHAFLIDQYNVNYMAEMYAGGGTGYDVCKDMQVKYIGADINPNPVRPDIYVCNALVDEIPRNFQKLILYSSICHIQKLVLSMPEVNMQTQTAG